MPVTCQFEVKNDCLHVMVEGALCSMNDMLKYIEHMHIELARTGLFKILVDETKCHMHMKLDGLGNVADELQEPKEFKTVKPKAAIVCSPVNYPLHRLIFDAVEKVKSFTDKEEAKKGLAEK